ncbi:MAG TPA: serine O-acetyltransferase, partial [Nitrospiraceae bacterium]|nr:serine O-acetyltransferase [Nitrospiraceae bacterium]
IGDNVKIGANSVVLKNVAPNSTVIGVPARVIKTQGERLPDATMDHSNLPDPVSDRIFALEQELIELRKKVENQDSPHLF